MMTKNFLIWLRYLIILGIVIGVSYAVYRWTQPNYQIFGFTGQVTAIDGQNVTVHGVFDAVPGLPEGLFVVRDLTFRIDEETLLQKEVVKWPTSEQMTAMGGKFNIEDLPRQKDVGLVQDL